MTFSKSKMIQQGAEANIIQVKNWIIKDRIKKSYRISELDKKMRGRRTRSEAKLLEKASKIINCPVPFLQPSIKNSSKLKMPFINGKKLSEHLDKFPLKKQKEICKQIGESVAAIHNANIIHGDLTTSNMILVENNVNNNRKGAVNNKKFLVNGGIINGSDKKNTCLVEGGGVDGGKKFTIYFIDFGLGFISAKNEDKAVDLHLLKQALEAKHFKNWEKLFNEVLKGYKKQKNSKIILERLKAVEKRGRYKGKH